MCSLMVTIPSSSVSFEATNFNQGDELQLKHTNAATRIGMLFLREVRSYIKPTNRVSHTKKYTHHERLAVVQT